MIPFVKSDGYITVYINGAPYSIDSTHINYEKVLGHLKANDITPEDMLSLLSIVSYVKGLNIGNVTVTADAVFYMGQPVHGHLSYRMIDIIKAGLDVTPWAKFLDNLMLNPSKTAVDELYLWLEKSNMPLTQDGCFLAYKKVKDDYTSYHNNADGTPCNNTIGTVVSMPRNRVDDNRNQTCSYGLHFCSWDYLPHYMGGQGRVVVVKINPKDVVSIPSDYDNAKGRAASYFIHSEVDEDKVAFAFSFDPVVDTDDDDYQAWLDEVNDGDTRMGFNEWKKSIEEVDTNIDDWDNYGYGDTY